jgi:hypothetical protein
MNLHQLVTLRNELQKAFNTSIIRQEIETNYLRLQHLSENIDVEFTDKILSIAVEHRQFHQQLDKQTLDIADAVQLVQSKIDDLSSKFFGANYQLELACQDPQIVRNIRQLQCVEDFQLSLIQRINLNSNWQYPALEIGCRDGEWTKYLIASDPLYISDVYDEFLISAVQQFPKLYQGRVKKYTIKDYYKIPNLPKNQFGFIFSFNFFNYLSLDSIKQLLIQSNEWLRPGGKILFTYNNADMPSAASYAENYFMTYVPKSILIPLAESIGFETIYSFDTEPAHSIIEFKKPGQLKSIKLGQTSGQIQVKN